MKKFFERKHSVVTISLVVNLLLFAFKFAIGMSNRSIAIRADAWHTLSDSLSSAIVMAGLWIGSRPGNEKYPYGFGRFEEITSITVGVMLGIIGFRFLGDSLSALLSTAAPAHYTSSSVLIMVITVLLKEGLAQASIRTGRKHDSLPLVADGWHHRSDALSSVVILMGMGLNGRIPRVDSILGIIVAAMILFAAFEIIKDMVRSIIGESIPEDMRNHIMGTAREMTPEMMELHNFKYHRYGRHIEISFHGYFHRDITLREAHDCVTKLERALNREKGIHCLIHPEVSP